MLAAKSAGYNSYNMMGFDFQKVDKIINLPNDHIIGMMFVVGKAKNLVTPRGE